MDDGLQTLLPKDFPALLREIIDPPKKLFVRGALPSDEHSFLAVVGSRRYSPYGAQVCEKLIRGLAGTNVVIVSGLALGIDALAHRSALSAGLPNIAVPGSGLSPEVLYPSAHRSLADDIVNAGGALLSEYEHTQGAAPWTFPKRNRIMAGLSHGVLVIEATEKSGTLITARLTSDYNRLLMAVPGSILGEHAKGSNRLLREGAIAITSSDEIRQELGIASSHDIVTTVELSPDESVIIEILTEPMTRDEIVRAAPFPVHQTQIVLSSLEIKGVVVERLGRLCLN